MKEKKVNPDNDRLSPSVWGILFSWKFTYNMHGDSYSQIVMLHFRYRTSTKNIPDNCRMFWRKYMERETTGIFRSNQDSVVKLLKENITRDGNIGLNYKHILVEINAKNWYRWSLKRTIRKNDRDVLTVLLLLMRNNKYSELLTSQTYKAVCCKDQYSAFINFNTANEELIIKRATDLQWPGYKLLCCILVACTHGVCTGTTA